MRKITYIIALILLFSCNKELYDLTKPKNFVASKGIFDNKIVLKWDAIAVAMNYQLFRYDFNAKELKLLVLTNNTQYEDTGIVSTEKSYYRLRMYNSENSLGTLSDSIYGYTKSYTGNSIPTNVIITKGTYSDKIILSWNKTLTGVGYEIYKLNQSSNEYTLLGSTNDLYYEDKTNTTGYTKIYYKIRAINADKEYSDFTNADYGYLSAKQFDFVSSFSTLAPNSDSYAQPRFLSIDLNDNLYVSENAGIEHIQKFNKNGSFIETFGTYNYPTSMLFLSDRIFVGIGFIIFEMDNNKQWLNTIRGQFGTVGQMAIDDENNIYIADYPNNRIHKIDLSGNLILRWDISGVGPWGVAYLNGKIYVSNGNIVNIFSKTGDYIKQWNFDTTIYNIRVKDEYLYMSCGTYVLKVNENRDFDIKIGQTELVAAIGLVFDSKNYLYVADRSQRIYVYKPR